MSLEPLDNSRHESFAFGVASGKTQAEAYRDAFPKAKRWKPSTLHAEATRLAHHPLVSPRIAALQKAAADSRIMDLTARNILLSDIARMGQQAVKDCNIDPLAMEKTKVAVAAVKELNATTGGYEQAANIPKFEFRIILPGGRPLVREPIKSITVEDAKEAERKRLAENPPHRQTSEN